MTRAEERLEFWFSARVRPLRVPVHAAGFTLGGEGAAQERACRG